MVPRVPDQQSLLIPQRQRKWKKIGKLLLEFVKCQWKHYKELKRKSESKEEKPAKKRRSGNEAIEFLKERKTLDYDLRKAEFEAMEQQEQQFQSGR